MLTAKKNYGFTLTEMLISIVIILLVLLMITSIFIISQRVMRQANYKAELIQNSRVALDLMSREIRQAKFITTTLPETSTNAPQEIMFEDGHDVSEIKYTKYILIDNKVYRQIFVYYFDTNPEIFVRYNDIDAFGSPNSLLIDEKLIGEYFKDLIFYGVDNINVDMTMEKAGTEIFIKTLINPRNI